MRFVAPMFMLLASTSVAVASDDPITQFFKGLAPKVEKQVEAFQPKHLTKTKPHGFGQHVRATYYNCCKKTANGEIFNKNGMTAAHKTLPFGTRVHITNPKNGRSVTVRINDRGPHTRGYSYDLAQGAARLIGFSSGPIIATILN